MASSRTRATIDRLVFFTPPEKEPNRARSFFDGRERLAAAAFVLVLAGVGWWLLVPPTVHRPAAAVWCPDTPRADQRFDARRILGRDFAEGHDLAIRNGCTVRDIGGGVDDDERSSRINVDVSRGVITRIDGIY